MSIVTSDERLERRGHFEAETSSGSSGAGLELPAWPSQVASPNALVRWAFYLSVFSIPFMSVYIPGTGERIGILRLVQVLLLGAVLSQPRVCLGLVPVALVWFVGYYALRLLSGLWLAPDLAGSWWPTTRSWLQFSLPWVLILFNVLQFPGVRRKGLWCFIAGTSFCALLHILGVGVSAVDDSVDEVRTTVFGENANIVGATYAAAVIVLIGLGMFRNVKLLHRLTLFPLIALVGLALAKTGSRTALLMVTMGILVLLLQAHAFASRTKRYASVALIAVVLAATIWQVPTILERFNELDPHNIGKFNPRARMAPVLWEIFLRSPLYGSGPDRYQFELTRRSMPYLIRDQRTIAAHNLVLLLLVETGVVGLLIFWAGLCQALAAAWRARRHACGYLPLAMLLPFFIAGIVLSNPTTDHVFWFAIAYALAGAA